MSSETFLAAVALREAGEDAYAATTQPVPWPKAYGGDLLAQAAAAATRSAGDDRSLNAIHSLFVAPASIGAEVVYSVDRLRDGRSYSTRQVTGREGDRIVVSALASFHTGEDGERIDAVPMPDAPDPEDVPSAADALAGTESAASEYWAGGRSFDLRHVGGAPYIAPVTGEPRRLRVWIRAAGELPDDPALHRIALAYVCDYSMLEPALTAGRRFWTQPGLVTASTDHALWIHDDVDLGRWLLCTLDLVSLGSGRATVSAEFHSRDGRHIASAVQQGVIRARSA